MKLAVMLMIVVLVFLVCNVLSLVVNILEAWRPDWSKKPLTEISNLGRRHSNFCHTFFTTCNSCTRFHLSMSKKAGKRRCRKFECCLKLVTINSSANIFIYTIFGEKFKRQLFRYGAKWCPCFKSAAESHFKRNQFEFAKSEATGYYGNTVVQGP